MNPSCKYLLLEYAFTVHGVQRVGLRCDARNARSARAIAALGATEEGVARAFRRGPHGEPVDTRVFSITDDDWPRVRGGLRARLGLPPDG